ncbi:MAG: heterocyst frequency control protein PatD [Jaaginema sp. PMC 1079.18]|nr:heterocyst frequency control protein PatD [Jaaginema sp. PMC 1080.18]MEC4852928.1 heterocyst frequency control protein PatD [Jaaginema sp. PMC 1079.18]MEC4865235.1 heterocyst frequency control protein PatD [Jaaginema sp. PMC 1078.18]
MLPVSHQQSYTELKIALEGLQTAIASEPPELERLEHENYKVQQVYQDRIVSLITESVDLAIASRWRSLHTEVNRSLRLLQTDIIFFKASRQVQTSQQRLTACLTRIEQLIGYCHELIGL